MKLQKAYQKPVKLKRRREINIAVTVPDNGPALFGTRTTTGTMVTKVGSRNVYNQHTFYCKNNIKDIRQADAHTMSSDFIKVSVVTHAYINILEGYSGVRQVL